MTINETTEEQRRKLQQIAEDAREDFSRTHEAREHALKLSREIIRNSANSIRATHRGEFERARDMIGAITVLTDELAEALKDHSGVYFAGFVEDALKEYVEANATLAFSEGSRLPEAKDLGVGSAPYLNGLAEAVGELRRFVLYSLRRDDCSRCEELLGLMDEVYTVLVSIDFPEAVTRGLRRSTDMARGILERTRGDLTVALQQRRLEQNINEFREQLLNFQNKDG